MIDETAGRVVVGYEIQGRSPRVAMKKETQGQENDGDTEKDQNEPVLARFDSHSPGGSDSASLTVVGDPQ